MVKCELDRGDKGFMNAIYLHLMFAMIFDKGNKNVKAPTKYYFLFFSHSLEETQQEAAAQLCRFLNG